MFGGTLLPVFDLRQKRHHVRNIPDGIQLIRSNLLRRNRAVPLSPIYHFGLPRKCHRLINQPFDDIFWDRQFADAQSDETYKADFTLAGDIDIGLSWSPPIHTPFRPGGFQCSMCCNGTDRIILSRSYRRGHCRKYVWPTLSLLIPKYIH